jgi:hypothetical protein
MQSTIAEATQEQERKDDGRSDRAETEESFEGRSLFEEIDLHLVPHA